MEGNSGTKNVQFTITLSSVSGRSVRADYATSDWTATAPDDYVAANSPLKLNPGETSKTVTVAVVGDTILEPHEDFYLILNPLFATVTTNGRATILNDD